MEALTKIHKTAAGRVNVVNIYDVAKSAGVSTATVSRVINESEHVSERTLKKVRAVMKEMNYTPSQLAVGLATKTTKTIGIMLPDVRDSFHAEVAYLIESKMTKAGYTCILCNTSMMNSMESDYIETLQRKNVDGIILVGSSYHNSRIDETFKKWESKIPMVLINAVSEEGTASVVCDEKEGIREALIYLKAQGRNRPVFIKDSVEYQKRASTTKAEAFESSYREVFNDRAVPKAYVSAPVIEEYLEILGELEKTDTDSILFTSDLCCAVFLKAMQKADKKAPEDYALVGFNNARITDLTTPTITTIDHLVAEHCEMAIDKLFCLMKGEQVEKVTYIRPKLVLKETT